MLLVQCTGGVPVLIMAVLNTTCTGVQLYLACNCLDHQLNFINWFSSCLNFYVFFFSTAGLSCSERKRLKMLFLNVAPSGWGFSMLV